MTDFILFYAQIDSEEWNKTQGQTVLRTWEVESAHNYENNQDIKMVTINYFETCSCNSATPPLDSIYCHPFLWLNFLIQEYCAEALWGVWCWGLVRSMVLGPGEEYGAGAWWGVWCWGRVALGRWVVKILLEHRWPVHNSFVTGALVRSEMMVGPGDIDNLKRNKWTFLFNF